ncbi:hypothetical protein WG909_05840 [Peptostreptococcaceae bacterium AGR-M142]
MNKDDSILFKMFSLIVGALILVFCFMTFLVINHNKGHFRNVSLDEFYHTKTNQNNKIVVIQLDEEQNKEIVSKIKELDAISKDENLNSPAINNNESIKNEKSNDEKKKIAEEFKKKINESSVNQNGEIKKSVLDELSQKESIKKLEKDNKNPLETKEEYKSINDYLKNKESNKH